MTLRKKIFYCLLISYLAISVLPFTATAEISISARSAVLIDSETGKVIYAKNADEILPPASTTKILTALLGAESDRLEQVFRISKNAASVGEASIHLHEGDEMSLLNILHGALIKSGNDAAVAIAEAVAPSEEEFVGMMNLKAKTIGAYDTQFCNTNGLPNDYHLTTAYDLALIARCALKNDTIADIVKKRYYRLAWETPKRLQQIKNTNILLWTYPYTTGIKTGTTFKAGKCLVSSAKKQEIEMIAVVLNAYDRYNDARSLLEYGYNIMEGTYAQ